MRGRRRVMTDGKIRSAKKLLKSGMLPREVAESWRFQGAPQYKSPKLLQLISPKNLHSGCHRIREGAG